MKRDLGSTYDGLKACPPRAAAALSHAMVETPAFLSGKLLLAMPGMADPRFERAVIAMCVHDENGAIGIGIGHKRAGISFRGLLRQLGKASSARDERRKWPRLQVTQRRERQSLRCTARSRARSR